VDIIITNYEMLEHFKPDRFVGIVLDESSILKSQDSKTRALITDMFSKTPYRLSCTATPSPNDHMELGNQAEFLGVMKSVEMMAMFFTHDGGDTSKWRLKGHGKTKFWEWLSTWAVCIKSPYDIGFDGSAYILPKLNMFEHIVECEFIPEGQLFAVQAETLNERRSAKRMSIEDRVGIVAEMVNASDEEWIVWCHLNDESSKLAQAIPDAVEVYGSLDRDKKEERLMGFTHGKERVLISKPSLSGFGMNWQHCRNMAFVGLDDSYESFYQAIRRCYRFGQKREVNVHIVGSEAEGNIRANIQRKQEQADLMSASMVEHMAEFMKKEIRGTTMDKSAYRRDMTKTDQFEAHLADCVELASELNENSIDFTVFSPPFASLYTYSNSDRDMGNVKDDEEFMGHFKFLVEQIYRITKPGRNVSFHCMNLPMTKFRDGEIGIKDFRGDLIRMFVEAGFIYHSEVVIWKDPVTAMQRTKALGLLHKQTLKDTAMSRQGIPDYLVTMRKPGQSQNPVTKTRDGFPVSKWQKYASPVWMDINPSKTLQHQSARESEDERHICPLQLEVIERAVELWSNPGDLVYSPFMGIGSEGYVAIQMGRRFIGSELKQSYYDVAVKNLRSAKAQQGSLFDEIDEVA
jgi:DNA modification methylase